MPKRTKLNAQDRRQRRSAALSLFVQATGRKTRTGGHDPNDRRTDRETTLALRHMRPADLDALLRDGDDA